MTLSSGAPSLGRCWEPRRASPWQARSRPGNRSLLLGLELVTGSFGLLPLPWLERQVAPHTIIANWSWVFLGNLLGSVAYGGSLAIALTNMGTLAPSGVAAKLVQVAKAKTIGHAALGAAGLVTALVKGILCNVLVCAAVWLAYAGRSVTDKIAALILPISAFIAAGFEHCVANMYFLPLAWLLVQTGHAPANFDASLITVPGIFHNLVPVTLGNIVGGAGFVGAVYWAIYRITFGKSR